MYQPRRQRNPLVIVGILTILGIAIGAFFYAFRFGIGGNDTETDLPELLPPTAPFNQAVTLSPEDQDALFYPSLKVPSLGIDSVIVSAALQADGWDVRVLGNRVGHLAYTDWLGEDGNIVLAGHIEMSDGSAGIFSRISQLRPGDAVIILENGVEYSYQVDQVRSVDAQDMSVIYTNANQVTLITCTDYNFFSGDYGERVVVTAKRVLN